MTTIMIIGHGAVGRHAAGLLTEAMPDAEIVLAGRDPSSVRPVPQTSTVRLDARDDAALHHTLRGVRVVLMCAELDNARIARACLARGIHYLDVTATHQLITQIERLDDLARTHHAAGVLSVGLVPGVTNLLARHCAERTPATRIRIGVLLGTGERHGPDAMRWTVDHLGELTGSWTTRFPAPHGTRTVHRFPFSDQFTLPTTLGVADVRTGLCLDSRTATLALKAANSRWVGRVLRRPTIRRALLAGLGTIHLGGEAFAVTAVAGTTQASLRGDRGSRVTGLVAALLVERLASLPSGVHHIEQLVDPADFLGRLARHGFTLQLEGIGERQSWLGSAR